MEKKNYIYTGITLCNDYEPKNLKLVCGLTKKKKKKLLRTGSMI